MTNLEPGQRRVETVAEETNRIYVKNHWSVASHGYRWLIQTGTDKQPIVVFELESTGEGTWTLTESPTGTLLGTEVLVPSTDRQEPTPVSSLRLFVGTNFVGGLFLTAAIKDCVSRNPRPLRIATNYLLVFVPKKPGTEANIRLSFYERL